MGSYLPHERAKSLFHLWAESYEHPCPLEARRHMAQGLRDLLGARLVLLCIVRDYREHGDARMTEEVDSGFGSQAEAEELLSAYAQATRDPGIEALLEVPGPTITKRRCELLDDRAWYRSDFVNNTRLAHGLDDVIYGHRFLGATTTIGIGINREPGDPPFSEEDRDLLDLFTGESAYLFREISKPGAALFQALSRRERETLDLLLSGLSEKEAAAKLGVSSHTAHTYVKRLYRRCQVRSRGELAALFLRR